MLKGLTLKNVLYIEEVTELFKEVPVVILVTGHVLVETDLIKYRYSKGGYVIFILFNFIQIKL